MWLKSPIPVSANTLCFSWFKKSSYWFPYLVLALTMILCIGEATSRDATYKSKNGSDIITVGLENLKLTYFVKVEPSWPMSRLSRVGLGPC